MGCRGYGTAAGSVRSAEAWGQSKCPHGGYDTFAHGDRNKLFEAQAFGRMGELQRDVEAYRKGWNRLSEDDKSFGRGRGRGQRFK